MGAVASYGALALVWFDRFGEHEDPVQKNPFTGIVSVLVYIFLVFYLFWNLQKIDSSPPVHHSDVIWSQMSGPFAMPLFCMAERCWVSQRYSAEAGAGCFHSHPADHGSKCHELRRGENITLNICYAAMPSTGLRLHFEGATAWQELAPMTGLLDDTDGKMCGWYVDSESITADGALMPMPAPICEGTASAYYVHTKNTTAKGCERKEWFVKQLSPVASETNFCHDACLSKVANNTRVHKTVLRMDPDYSQISVCPRPKNFGSLLGIVGGALTSVDEIISAIIFLFVSTKAVQRFMKPAVKELPFGVTLSSVSEGSISLKTRAKQLVKEARIGSDARKVGVHGRSAPTKPEPKVEPSPEEQRV